MSAAWTTFKSRFLERAERFGFAFALLILTLLFFSSIVSSTKILNNIHYINDLTFTSEHFRKFLHEGEAFPLWTPYFYAGQPLIGVPEYYLIDLDLLYLWLFNNIFLAMNLTLISYFFLAGLGMYLFSLHHFGKRPHAFLSAAVYLFNGFMLKFIIPGHLTLIVSYALLPFALLFLSRALLHKQMRLAILYALLCGLMLSLMILAGSIIFFLYSLIVIGLFFFFHLLGSGITSRLIRIMIVGLFLAIALFGFSAAKLLPTLEFVSLSSRGAGVSYQDFLGYPISFSHAFGHLVNAHATNIFSAAIGIVGLLLMLLGLLSWRKKIAMLSFVLIALGILLSAGTFVSSLFYNLPGFSQMRHIERALFLFVLGASLLVPFGVDNLLSLSRKYMPKVKEGIVLSALILVVLLELAISQPLPQSIDILHPRDVDIIDAVSQEKGDFRIATMSLPTAIGASGYNFYTQLNISEVKGGGGIWMPEYVQYLSVAQQSSPAALFGVLSAKYIIAKDPVNDPGLVLLGEHNVCAQCPIWEAQGPLLYENTRALPKASIVPRSALLVGTAQSTSEFALIALMQYADPRTIVLVTGKERIGEYLIGELSLYDAIILLQGSVGQQDGSLLQQYADRGGELLPNLVLGEQSITEKRLFALLGSQDSENDNTENNTSSQQNSKTLTLTHHSFVEASVDLSGESGWLVLSERFAHFPGWRATIDGKEIPLFAADSVITALPLSGERGLLTFRYEPRSFRKGLSITLISLTLFLLYIGYLSYLRFFPKRKEPLHSPASEASP